MRYSKRYIKYYNFYILNKDNILLEVRCVLYKEVNDDTGEFMHHSYDFYIDNERYDLEPDDKVFNDLDEYKAYFN